MSASGAAPDTTSRVEIRVANAPCSWGVLEYAGRPAAGWAQVLDEMAEAGYDGTELGDWGFLPTDSAQLRAVLDRRGLVLLSAYVPVRLRDPGAHAAGRQAALQAARLLSRVSSHPLIVLADDTAADPVRAARAGRITPAERLGAAEWRTLIDGVHDIARAVRGETGLRTCVHPHCATFIETAAEIAALLADTDPALVGLCADTGHQTYAGADAAAVIREAGPRLWHVHFKDCDGALAAQARREAWDYGTAVGRGLFCELGRGVVDFPAVLAELSRGAYRGWAVVEQDVLPSMGTPAESARRNRLFLRGLGL